VNRDIPLTTQYPPLTTQYQYMKFDDYRISAEIKQNLSEAGFKKPTDIQYKAILPIQKGEDVLAIAQTGTGKTAAFAIPIIDKLQYTKNKYGKQGVKCLVMVPTRELAMQIETAFNKLGKNTKLKFLSLYGGVEQDLQVKRLDNGVDVLISTPGRMFDLVHQKHLDLRNVEILVLDEADHMLALGFLKDIQDMLRFIPKKRQTLFFSATIDNKIKEVAYSLVQNQAIRIQISPDNKVANNITHSVAYVEMDDKRFFLERILKENPEKKILVFVRTKVRAERVCAAMERVGIKSVVIHGGKDQQERTAVMKDFRAGTIKLMIATDVSARGIDIEKVEMVVNYDLPDEPENYVHRVGRTGRGNQKGLAVSFCSAKEKQMLAMIEEYLGKPITKIIIDEADYEATIDLTTDPTIQYDPMSLIRENEAYIAKNKKPNKKRK
jgi:ATP-dependent RNA helicase RhlE